MSQLRLALQHGRTVLDRAHPFHGLGPIDQEAGGGQQGDVPGLRQDPRAFDHRLRGVTRRPAPLRHTFHVALPAGHAAADGALPIGAHQRRIPRLTRAL